eukprot:6480753-Amphidinium_carterae.1
MCIRDSLSKVHDARAAANNGEMFARSKYGERGRPPMEREISYLLEDFVVYCPLFLLQFDCHKMVRLLSARKLLNSTREYVNAADASKINVLSKTLRKSNENEQIYQGCEETSTFLPVLDDTVSAD